MSKLQKKIGWMATWGLVQALRKLRAELTEARMGDRKMQIKLTTAILMSTGILLACSPKPNTSESIPVVNGTKISAESCISEDAFNQIVIGMTSATVTNALGKGWRTTDSNLIGQYEFKTLQWKSCDTLYSVTFKNDAVDSKFMIGGVR